MNRFHRKSRFQQLCMRFSDGGGSAVGDPAEVPGGAEPAKPAAPATPEKSAPESAATKTYTEVELVAAKAQAVEDFKRHQEESKDFDKMTDAEKVVFLQAQRVDDQLTQYATGKLAAQEMPVELLPYAKGKDEADTDTRIKALKGLMDKAVQQGVEKRFGQNGYLPRGNAAGETKSGGTKRERGVSVK